MPTNRTVSLLFIIHGESCLNQERTRRWDWLYWEEKKNRELCLWMKCENKWKRRRWNKWRRIKGKIQTDHSNVKYGWVEEGQSGNRGWGSIIETGQRVEEAAAPRGKGKAQNQSQAATTRKTSSVTEEIETDTGGNRHLAQNQRSPP